MNKSPTPPQADEQLPAVPSGFELLDMFWRDFTPFAEPLLVDLADEIAQRKDPVRETQLLYAAWLAATNAHDELRQTPKTSIRWKARARSATARWSRFSDQSLVVIAAIAATVLAVNPTAHSAQVLLMTRDRFRTLLQVIARQAAR
jgi:hypothetical protein